jgi:hypothetical protein
MGSRTKILKKKEKEKEVRKQQINLLTEEA